MKKINYTGSSKVIKRLCEAINEIIDGGTGTNVEIERYLSEGVPVADITIDDETTRLYAPAGGGEGGSYPLYFDDEGFLCIDYDLVEERNGD